MRTLLRTLYQPFVRVSKKMSRKSLYPFLERQFAAIRPRDRVLSVGAGGEINRLLRDYRDARGFRLIEVDIDLSCRPGIAADICDWSAPDRFDVVVMGEVLEHCKRPHSAVENLEASLRPGGRLVLTVPFVFPIHGRPVDYYRFTRFGLEMLLADFENVRIDERNSWAEALAVLAARTFKSENHRLKAVAPLFITAATVAYPALWLIGRLFPDDTIATGYQVTASRPRVPRKQPA